MTVDEFMNDLEGLGQELSQPQQLLLDISDNIIAGMKSRVPVRSGDLKRSITAIIEGDNRIVFTMLDYGVYLNYGVTPNVFKTTNRGSFLGVITDPYPAPGFGMGRGYQPPRRYGMKARVFYDESDITQQIGDSFLDEILVDF